jgi:hypothetical protein
MRPEPGPQRQAAVERSFHRIYTPFNDRELELIDQYRFAHRIRERSEAIRRATLGFLASAVRSRNAPRVP